MPEIFAVAPTQDGRHVTVLATFTPEKWSRWCHAFGRPELASTAAFDSLYRGGYDAIKSIMADAYRERTLADIMDRIDGADLPGVQVMELAQAYRSEQARVNGVAEVSQHPHLGRIRQARPAPIMGGTPLRIAGPAPLLGEHTAEILRELGYTPQQVAAMRAGGALAKED